jgi:hypothetical protein
LGVKGVALCASWARTGRGVPAELLGEFIRQALGEGGLAHAALRAPVDEMFFNYTVTRVGVGGVGSEEVGEDSSCG